MTKDMIDSKIETLNNRIKNIENRPTEVYSRIVGYYRSVKNWNNGKSAEYKVRKTFMEPEIMPCQPPVFNPVENEATPAEAHKEGLSDNAAEEAAAVETTLAVETALEKSAELFKDVAMNSDNQADLFSLQADDQQNKREETAGRYLFFFRTTCPNCPPMKEFLSLQNWKGSHINVDEEEGLNAAVENSVFTAPTVILLSGDGSEIFRADNVAAMREYVESELRSLSAV